MIHAAIIVPLAFQRVALLNLDDDKAFGWDERVALPSAIAVGYGNTFHITDTSERITIRYFIWDTLDAIFSFDAVGFVLHGDSKLPWYHSCIAKASFIFRVRLHSDLHLHFCGYSHVSCVHALISL